MMLLSMPFAAIRIGIDPIAFNLGPIAIHWYGIMYAVAIYIGVEVAKRYVTALHADEQVLWDFLPWGIAAGLIGGRLYYVVQNRQSYYLTHPEHILAFWEGGMAFFGAIGAVLIATIVFARLSRVSVLPMLDVVAIFAAVGQPIGRIGNIINGDIVGYKTSLPWGTIYTNPHSFAPQLGVAYQPAAVYEILANVVLLGVLWLVLHRWRPPGLAAGLYVVGYSLTQFAVFFWRNNSIAALGLKQAQLTAIVTLILSLAFVAVIALKERRQQVVRAGLEPREV
ncbi:MAG TPA: prolipoprotein diacylglyceryl transferase [Dehalococcoidia bacterium]|nr:prolipoprotein diacylglyceryl transferase [Dehalococcoidia bacterium]